MKKPWTREDVKCVAALMCLPAVYAALCVLFGFAMTFMGPLIHIGCDLGESVLEWLGLPT